MIWILVILILIELPISIMVGTKFKMFSKNKKLMMESVAAVCLVVVAGLIISGLVEIIPGGKGEFGNWLSFWGAIFGGIINTIVAALVSRYVTSQTYANLDHEKAIREYQFKVQTDNRYWLIDRFNLLRPIYNSVGDIAIGARRLKKEYMDGEFTNFKIGLDEKETSNEQKLVRGLEDICSRGSLNIGVFEKNLEEIMNHNDYPVFRLIDNGNGNLSDLVTNVQNEVKEIKQFTSQFDNSDLYVNGQGNNLTLDKIRAEEDVIARRISSSDLQKMDFYSAIDRLPTKKHLNEEYDKISELLSNFIA
ncbi:hypothetical protein [Levilactobacillus brevis]